MAKALSLGRSESFALRDGWTVKALEAIPLYGKNTFSKEEGISILGIGSNMVKSLKYWLYAAGILTNTRSVELSEFGKELTIQDPYMVRDLSWLLCHYFLTSNVEAAPVFYYVFRVMLGDVIDPKALLESLALWLEEDYTINRKTLEKDISVFFNTYYQNDPSLSPEENNVSPLVRLNLFDSRNKEKQYVLKAQSRRTGMYLLLYYLLKHQYGESFDIRDAFYSERSPVKVFRICETLFNEYLREMSKAGLIRIDRTAGLNAVYLLKEMSLEKLYILWNQEGGK